MTLLTTLASLFTDPHAATKREMLKGRTGASIPITECACVGVAIGSHLAQVNLRRPDHMSGREGDLGLPTHIGVDRCVAMEVTGLWSLGITTTGSCCGHNAMPGFIGVIDDDIERMIDLGYRVQHNPSRPGDRDSFDLIGTATQ